MTYINERLRHGFALARRLERARNSMLVAIAWLHPESAGYWATCAARLVRRLRAHARRR